VRSARVGGRGHLAEDTSFQQLRRRLHLGPGVVRLMRRLPSGMARVSAVSTSGRSLAVSLEPPCVEPGFATAFDPPHFCS